MWPVNSLPLMTFNDALTYLLGLGHETLAIKLGLEKSELLLKALDDPQNSYLKVQIAGTNGKGSTAAFVEAICREAGIRTGLYTSPHLTRITERIRIDGEEIEESQFGQFVALVRERATALIERGEIATPPSFFEHVTATALCAFAEAMVEVAILETGLGGRLDSTTAARAELVSITPVDFDHQEYLGDNLTQIAAEKAAIIRPGVAAVIALQEQVVLDVIFQRCSETGVTPILVQEADWTLEGKRSDGRIAAAFRVEDAWISDVVPGLHGRHQLVNAATAVAIAVELREIGFHIPNDSIKKGLEEAKHPGRLELIEGVPAFLLDGAHNPHGARALAAYLREFISGPITLVFGAMRDKDLISVLNELAPLASVIVLTPVDNPRSATTEELRLALGPLAAGRKVIAARSVHESIDKALESASNSGTICVAGSLYLVGEARTKIKILGEGGKGKG